MASIARMGPWVHGTISRGGMRGRPCGSNADGVPEYLRDGPVRGVRGACFKLVERLADIESRVRLSGAPSASSRTSKGLGSPNRQRLCCQRRLRPGFPHPTLLPVGCPSERAGDRKEIRVRPDRLSRTWNQPGAQPERPERRAQDIASHSGPDPSGNSHRP